MKFDAMISLKAGASILVAPYLLLAVQALAWRMKTPLTITSGKDGIHREGSFHHKGLAVDIVPTNRSLATAAWRAEAIDFLTGCGIKVLDEYARPSRLSTGGHLHLEFR